MTRLARFLLIPIVLATVVMPLAAHDEFRIIGTLEKQQASAISVKKRTGGTVSIKINKQTEITQNNKKVDTTALKVGQSLVIDAYGDTEDDSLAIEIRIVPPIR